MNPLFTPLPPKWGERFLQIPYAKTPTASRLNVLSKRQKESQLSKFSLQKLSP
jgi:hypothetical protein